MLYGRLVHASEVLADSQILGCDPLGLAVIRERGWRGGQEMVGNREGGTGKVKEGKDVTGVAWPAGWTWASRSSHSRFISSLRLLVLLFQIN